MSIFREFTKLSQGAYIDLYTLDLNPLGVNTVFRFVPGENADNTIVGYKGLLYEPLPIKVEGFELTQKAPFPRPTLLISNVESTVSTLMAQYSQLIGAKLTRIRTLVNYLDGRAEEGGEASPSESYFVETILEENELTVSFELINGLEMGGLTLPKRFISRRCVWQYRGFDCGYTGVAMFTDQDQATDNLRLDRCSHTINGCQLRFGTRGELPHGGFPSVDLY